jgi:hypothetical protein
MRFLRVRWSGFAAVTIACLSEGVEDERFFSAAAMGVDTLSLVPCLPTPCPRVSGSAAVPAHLAGARPLPYGCRELTLEKNCQARRTSADARYSSPIARFTEARDFSTNSYYLDECEEPLDSTGLGQAALIMLA